MSGYTQLVGSHSWKRIKHKYKKPPSQKMSLNFQRQPNVVVSDCLSAHETSSGIQQHESRTLLLKGGHCATHMIVPLYGGTSAYVHTTPSTEYASRPAYAGTGNTAPRESPHVLAWKSAWNPLAFFQMNGSSFSSYGYLDRCVNSQGMACE